MPRLVNLHEARSHLEPLKRFRLPARDFRKDEVDFERKNNHKTGYEGC